MSLFSAFLGCLICCKSPVSDDVGGPPVKECSSSDHKAKRKSKSSGAPIVVSYFPVNSNLSRL
ncbi:hypothetical protein I3843_13G031800 [Carya illinoinensis]|uniref:Uncharacterized protein n=1 Tax=Carya illinoinensis TaxID=32201 RepID=A0A922AFC1_CARIL|nr:hypothetical protein I3760_13G034500 [Carya illinoinensis]KAG6680302.1 hypothetical protein I3842_13G035300 [Carya illinoinensis]KAG7948883.1 hypothetical protein I3843_13G031800 [Carya illinoinensis]